MPANTPATPAAPTDARKPPAAAPAQSGVAPQKQPDRKITIDQLLADLVADKLVDKETADKLAAVRRSLRSSDIHPLIVLADQKWKDPRNPKKLLTLEAMKMEHSLTAPFDGIIAELNAVAGAQVQVEALLAKIEAAE